MCNLESLTFEDLKNKVANALLNKEAIKTNLKAKIQQLQQEVEENALRAVELCIRKNRRIRS